MQIETAMDVADELRVARNAASERRKSSAKSGFAERAGDRPCERRRDARQCLADVHAAPYRRGVTAFRKSEAGDGARLENPEPGRIARELHVPRMRIVLFQPCGDGGKLFDAIARERRRLRIRDGALDHFSVLD